MTLTMISHSEIMVDMEGGIGAEVSTASSLSCLTNMEDVVGPCWAWVSNWIDMSVENSFIG